MASDNFHVRSCDRALRARIISSTAGRLTAVGTISLFLILAAFSRANAFVYDKGYYVEATSTAYNQLPFCNAPGCTHYVTDGGRHILPITPWPRRSTFAMPKTERLGPGRPFSLITPSKP